MTSAAKGVPSPIERLSEVPFYQQLASALTEQIKSGVFAEGARLPSESQLCEEFGVSRATVRQALQHLESNGMVYRVTNRGVFVGRRTGDHGWMIQNTEGFLENALTHQNRSVTTSVLQAGHRELPAWACEQLQVPDGTIGYELVRVRFLDGQPTVYSTNYLPPPVSDLIAGSSKVLDGTAGLSETLTRAGYPLAGANRFVQAVMPTTDIAKALAVNGKHPLVQIRSTSWRPDGKAFDVYETYVRTDIVPLEVNVRTS